jgi:1-deoxy-D-xylulose-5-phosphate synthase
LDRGGLVGADGPTHHGLYDLSYLRCIPNIVVAAPMNECELQDMMMTAASYEKGAFAIRYPRGEVQDFLNGRVPQMMEIGKGELLTEGEDLVIVSIGTMGNQARKAVQALASEGIHVGHANMRFVKPIDTQLLDQLARKYRYIVTIEDGTRIGGFGSAVAEYIVENHTGISVKIMGIPDEIIEHGSQDELYREVGIDAQALVTHVRSVLLAH